MPSHSPSWEQGRFGGGEEGPRAALPSLHPAHCSLPNPGSLKRPTPGSPFLPPLCTQDSKGDKGGSLVHTLGPQSRFTLLSVQFPATWTCLCQVVHRAQLGAQCRMVGRGEGSVDSKPSCDVGVWEVSLLQ